eukprot:g4279.t1
MGKNKLKNKKSSRPAPKKKKPAKSWAWSREEVDFLTKTVTDYDKELQTLDAAQEKRFFDKNGKPCTILQKYIEKVVAKYGRSKMGVQNKFYKMIRNKEHPDTRRKYSAWKTHEEIYMLGIAKEYTSHLTKIEQTGLSQKSFVSALDGTPCTIFQLYISKVALLTNRSYKACEAKFYKMYENNKTMKGILPPNLNHVVSRSPPRRKLEENPSNSNSRPSAIPGSSKILRTPWSPTEDEALRKGHKQGLADSKLALLLPNRSVNSVRYRRKLMGLQGQSGARNDVRVNKENPNPKWGKREDAILLKEVKRGGKRGQKATDEEIAAIIGTGRSARSVARRLVKLGLRRTVTREFWTKAEDKLIRCKYKEGYLDHQIADMLGDKRTIHAVTNRIFRLKFSKKAKEQRRIARQNRKEKKKQREEKTHSAISIETAELMLNFTSS